MHDVINFLKAAVTRGPSPGIMGCYVVRGGSIYARNQTFQAGFVMEVASSFNAPADELDAALSRMKTVESLAVDEATLTIKAGRLKSVIKLNPDEPPEMPTLPTVWQRCPPALTAALTLAQHFIGEHGWSQGIRLMDGRITAMNNRSGIDIKVDGLELPVSLLTQDVAAFLIAQGAPDKCARDGDSLFFQWADGRWLRTQLLNYEMPAQVEIILETAGAEAPIVITEEWREAYADVSALSDGHIVVTRAGLKALRGEAISDVTVGIEGLEKEHASRWITKVLDPVIACAKAWNPAAHPKPALFVGENIRGVVMGVKL